MQIYNIDFIFQALNEAGWKPIRSVAPWLLIPAEINQETHYLSLCFYENEKILFVKGSILASVKEEQEMILMEFIQAGNHHLPISNFEYDFQNKELNCRSGIFCNNITLTTQLIHNLVYEVYSNVRQYIPVVRMLFEQQKPVDDIFAGK